MSGVHTENREWLSLWAESGAPHTGEEVTFASPGVLTWSRPAEAAGCGSTEV